MTDSLPAQNPKAILDRIEASSERFETSCGQGVMVWHAWGDGPVLALLHGGNGSWRHWVRNIPVLARQFRVVAPDLPGLGESDESPSPPTQAGIAQIVADGLNTVIGADTAYDIAGFSFGGMISSLVAALHGERVRSLTVNGPGGLGGRARTLDLVPVRDKIGAERVAGHRINLARLMIHDPTHIDDLALEIQEWHSVRNRLRTPLLSRSMSTAEALAEVRAPKVGAIYGEFDAPAYPQIDERETLLRNIRPDLDFRVIRGAGHWTSYEAAETFNATLLEMLRASG
ncbi:MAG: alpha/beta fold hydrolase [Alphaproteobacteria bacterium]|nr:alpha/beta fold hydrolase [Alphaproteobacteria bacterium]